MKPKILFTIGNPNIGGVQKLLLWLITSPVMENYSCRIISTITRGGPMVEVFRNNGIEFDSCAFPVKYENLTRSYTLNKYIKQLFTTLAFYRKLNSNNPDIVHFHQMKNILSQIKIVNTRKIPWLFTLHGQQSINIVSKHLQFVNLINNSKSLFTCVSKATIDQSDFTKDILENKKFVVHNGIKYLDYQGYKNKSQAIRSKLGIPTEAIVFGSAGSFIELKRFDIFINAACKVKENYANAYFFLAGSGPLEDDYRMIIQDNKMEKYFFIIPRVSDIREFLAEVDVFILTSRTEGVPIVLLEACAMGIPCIATEVGGIPEVFGGNVVIVQPNSTKMVSNGMLSLMKNDTRKEYSNKSISIAKSNNIDNTACNYVKLYEKLH